MKICAIPLDIVFASPEENLLAAAHALSQVEKDTDVVVLPELFTTAFVADPKTLAATAEPRDGKTMENVRRWAQFFGMAIAGSFLCVEDGHYYNRAFFTEPGGDTTFYDKRHLFPLSEEDKVFTPGRSLPPLIRFRGWEFTLVICFDIRFPVWCRNTPGRLYDVLLVPCNWAHSRADQLMALARARAIENQAYSIACNRTGTDPYGEYLRKDSGMWDNLGNPIHETRRNGHLYTLLERRDIDEGRRRFPAYKASDTYTIDL